MSETQPDNRPWIEARAYFLGRGEGCPEGRPDEAEADRFPARDPSSHTGVAGERTA